MRPAARRPLAFLASSCLILAACQVGTGEAPTGADGSGPVLAFAPDVPVSVAPFDTVHADWKQRLEELYVYVELEGDYRGIGGALERADTAMRAQGLEAAGPPFALYYDDPATVPTDRLRARACFPVAAPSTPDAPLAYDVLDGATVVYAFAAGPYPEVPRAYPGLYAYLERIGWEERPESPVREVYLVNPASVDDWDELVCEIQIAAQNKR